MSEYTRESLIRIAIIGGDLRYIYLANMLHEQGFLVTMYGNDPHLYPLSEQDLLYFTKNIETTNTLVAAVKDQSVIITPTPFSKDGENITMNKQYEPVPISNFLSRLIHKPFVFGGAIKPSVIEFFHEHDINYCDLMKIESVAIGNAIATAEGTILEAIQHSKTNLHQSRALILGYGRCAKILAHKLKGLDVYVTVAARKEEALAYAKASGYQTTSLQNETLNLSDYEFIFNTIPANLLTQNVLKTARKDVTIIDIASAPGGVDFHAASTLGLNASLCLALPGLYAPKASASILLDAIKSKLTSHKIN